MINDLEHISFRKGVNELVKALKEEIDNDMTFRYQIYPFKVIDEVAERVKQKNDRSR